MNLNNFIFELSVGGGMEQMENTIMDSIKLGQSSCLCRTYNLRKRTVEYFLYSQDLLIL